MSPRPDALGLKVTIKSFDEVDPILHELAWLANQKTKLDAETRKKTDAIVQANSEKYFVEIDGQNTAFGDRYEQLETLLEEWVAEKLEDHLEGKKRSRVLPHGTVGLRQQPKVVEIDEESSEASVLDAIDEELDSLITKIREWGVKRLKSLGCLVQDLVTIKVGLNLAGIRKAVDEKRLTAEQIEAFGLEIREPYDLAQIKPNQLVVSQE